MLQDYVPIPLELNSGISEYAPNGVVIPLPFHSGCFKIWNHSGIIPASELPLRHSFLQGVRKCLRSQNAYLWFDCRARILVALEYLRRGGAPLAGVHIALRDQLQRLRADVIAKRLQ